MAWSFWALEDDVALAGHSSVVSVMDSLTAADDDIFSESDFHSQLTGDWARPGRTSFIDGNASWGLPSAVPLFPAGGDSFAAGAFGASWWSSVEVGPAFVAPIADLHQPAAELHQLLIDSM
ncbi:unnamed protein product [Calypogeia fissa]